MNATTAIVFFVALCHTMSGRDADTDSDNSSEEDFLTEIQEEILCKNGNDFVLSCHDGKFIDMLPGGEYYAPTAHFILNYSCPENHGKARILGDGRCDRNATVLVSRCHGKTKCILEPSLASQDTGPEGGCRSMTTDVVLFRYRCFDRSDTVNFIDMLSEKTSMGLAATSGHIFSPEFPNAVPAQISNQSANCFFRSHNNETMNLTITMQSLRLDGNSTHCMEKLDFLADGQNQRSFCGPIKETSLAFNLSGSSSVEIVYTKCYNEDGGTFWISFQASRRINVECSGNVAPSNPAVCTSGRDSDLDSVKENTTRSEGTTTAIRVTASPAQQQDESLAFVLGAALGSATFAVVAVTLIILVLWYRRRRKTESDGRVGPFSALDRLSRRSRERRPEENTYNVTGNEPTYTMNGRLPNEELQPDTAADADAQPSNSQGENAAGLRADNQQYAYACVDKLKKRHEPSQINGYDQVVEFGPDIDNMRSLTGSDTLMHENDLYDSDRTKSSTSYSYYEENEDKTDRTSFTTMEDNSELYYEQENHPYQKETIKSMIREGTNINEIEDDETIMSDNGELYDANGEYMKQEPSVGY